jgi:hypothetical protein
MTSGLYRGPQHSVNQRPAMALLPSADMAAPFL